MSNLGTFVIHNGKLKRRTEIQFSLDHRCVRFADGFFETIRAFAINVPLLSLHYERIQKAFDILLLNKNKFPDEETLRFDIERLIKSNKHFGSSRVRLTIYRAGKGNYSSDSDDIDWYIETIPLENKEFGNLKKGIHISVFEMIEKPISPLYSVKINHAIFYILAAEWAKKNELDDAVLINSKQNLVEATSSNIFVLIDKIIYTPPLSDGCVDGVMRKYVLNYILPQLGVEVKETSITKQVLLDADEIFLTNAITGCQTVLAYQSRRYYNNLSSQIINKLNEKLIYEQHH